MINGLIIFSCQPIKRDQLRFQEMNSKRSDSKQRGDIEKIQKGLPLLRNISRLFHLKHHSNQTNEADFLKDFSLSSSNNLFCSKNIPKFVLDTNIFQEKTPKTEGLNRKIFSSNNGYVKREVKNEQVFNKNKQSIHHKTAKKILKKHNTKKIPKNSFLLSAHSLSPLRQHPNSPPSSSRKLAVKSIRPSLSLPLLPSVFIAHLNEKLVSSNQAKTRQFSCELKKYTDSSYTPKFNFDGTRNFKKNFNFIKNSNAPDFKTTEPKAFIRLNKFKKFLKNKKWQRKNHKEQTRGNDVPAINAPLSFNPRQPFLPQPFSSLHILPFLLSSKINSNASSQKPFCHDNVYSFMRPYCSDNFLYIHTEQTQMNEITYSAKLENSFFKHHSFLSLNQRSDKQRTKLAGSEAALSSTKCSRPRLKIDFQNKDHLNNDKKTKTISEKNEHKNQNTPKTPYDDSKKILLHKLNTIFKKDFSKKFKSKFHSKVSPKRKSAFYEVGYDENVEEINQWPSTKNPCKLCSHNIIRCSHYNKTDEIEVNNNNCGHAINLKVKNKNNHTKKNIKKSQKNFEDNDKNNNNKEIEETLSPDIRRNNSNLCTFVECKHAENEKTNDRNKNNSCKTQKTIIYGDSHDKKLESKDHNAREIFEEKMFHKNSKIKLFKFLNSTAINGSMEPCGTSKLKKFFNTVENDKDNFQNFVLKNPFFHSFKTSTKSTKNYDKKVTHLTCDNAEKFISKSETLSQSLIDIEINEGHEKQKFSIAANKERRINEKSHSSSPECSRCFINEVCNNTQCVDSSRDLNDQREIPHNFTTGYKTIVCDFKGKIGDENKSAIKHKTIDSAKTTFSNITKSFFKKCRKNDLKKKNSHNEHNGNSAKQKSDIDQLSCDVLLNDVKSSNDALSLNKSELFNTQIETNLKTSASNDLIEKCGSNGNEINGDKNNEKASIKSINSQSFIVSDENLRNNDIKNVNVMNTYKDLDKKIKSNNSENQNLYDTITSTNDDYEYLDSTKLNKKNKKNDSGNFLSKLFGSHTSDTQGCEVVSENKILANSNSEIINEPTNLKNSFNFDKISILSSEQEEEPSFDSDLNPWRPVGESTENICRACGRVSNDYHSCHSTPECYDDDDEDYIEGLRLLGQNTFPDVEEDVLGEFVKFYCCLALTTKFST